MAKKSIFINEASYAECAQCAFETPYTSNSPATCSIGGFTNGQYWCSTEHSSIYAKYQIFSSGSQFFTFKYSDFYVRACRSFTAGVGDYVVGDTGPAGGLIFYIDGTIYYEAAPSDQSTGEVWSNVNKEIGVTAQGEAIGTGQANTTAIIGQTDHTNSAAKLCDDLVI